MCINKEVSIGVFFLCSLSCMYLYKRNLENDRWISILFGYFGIVQLLEYFMWIDQDCKGLNQTATNIGIIHNVLQPILSFGLAYYFTKGKIPIYVYIIFGLYLITSMPKIIEMEDLNHCSKPCKDDSHGLSWPYTKTHNMKYVWLIFCLSLALPLLSMKKNGLFYCLILIIMYIISHFISMERCPNNVIPPNGSWWCLLAAILPILKIMN